MHPDHSAHTGSPERFRMSRGKGRRGKLKRRIPVPVPGPFRAIPVCCLASKGFHQRSGSGVLNSIACLPSWTAPGPDPLVRSCVSTRGRFVSVLFSYYVNSKYVFKRTFLTRRKAIKQFNIFILSRIAGIFFDSSILYFCIHFIRMPNLIAKTISCTSTALINYLIGKHIFKA